VQTESAAVAPRTSSAIRGLPNRLKRNSREDADETLGKLIDEVESYLPAKLPDGAATQPVVSMDLHTRLCDVSLFTIIATLGAPLEVTAANLAIETFLPADAESAARLRELTERPERAAAAWRLTCIRR
jgi:hypothetical protein